ncbi:glycosyltransferase [Natronomonas halophila]|uniref:glycosyltransferase family 4 protein n=1 Tax=Natronomonas halophila TaxID=2747817 RepID=UPI0015B3D64C|nr:glycosyltransferase [Natronomonas halophila]QLD84628.1 glycosyltransferase [Natronomonas halophila]QLD84682.1 glycosyltransferase [Natronomonas halophila]
MSADSPTVSVVIQPGKKDNGPMTHQTESLCDILSAVATVQIVALNAAVVAPLADDYDILEVGDGQFPDGIAAAAVQFLVNQIRLGVALARADTDVVLFYGATTYAIPMAIARLGGADVIAQPKGDVAAACYADWRRSTPTAVARVLATGVKLLERTGFAVAHGTAVYTPTMARSLGLDPESASVYADAARFVDTEAFSVDTPPAERPDHVVFVGRLDADKRIDIILEAARQLGPEIDVTLVGNGPQADRLADAPPNVTHEGWVPHDEVPAYLADAQAVILASEQEGLPTVLLEAYACGTPVVAPRVGGIEDAITDALTGEVYSTPDADQLAASARRVVEEYDSDVLAQNCRAIAEGRFSRAAAVDRYRTMLEQLSTQYAASTTTTPEIAEVPT